MLRTDRENWFEKSAKPHGKLYSLPTLEQRHESGMLYSTGEWGMGVTYAKKHRFKKINPQATPGT